MNRRAQTTIELLLILAISMLALGIVYSLYSLQIDFSNSSKESVSSKAILEKMVNTANTLYISGPGSRTKVLVDLPMDLKMEDSSIRGSTLYLRLSNGTDLFASADVNFSGDWKKLDGAYVTGQYFISMLFDGNVVRLFYDDYDLSNESIYVSAKNNTVSQKSFSVRNNSLNNATFWILGNFSHSPFAEVSINPADTHFVLPSGESKLVDFDISLNSSASGNYAGSIIVIGQINNGVSDANNTKQVSVSVESFSGS